MKKLTKIKYFKDGHKEVDFNVDFTTQKESFMNLTQTALNKLSDYETLEEYVGTQFSTIFKALEEGIFIVYDNHIWDCTDLFLPIRKGPDGWGFRIDSFTRTEEDGTKYSVAINQLFYFKDYKKTWAIELKDLSLI